MGDRHRSGKRLKLDGQPMRLLRYIREHPGASSLEITRDLYIVNVTGRVSDLRAAGFQVVCRRRPDGADGYFAEVEPVHIHEWRDDPDWFWFSPSGAVMQTCFACRGLRRVQQVGEQMAWTEA